MLKFLMKFFLGLYVFLFIFNPTNFFSFNLLYLLFVVALLSVPFNFKHYHKLLCNKKIFVYILFLLYITCYLFVLGLRGGVDAFYMAYNYFLVLLSFFCCMFVVITYGRLYSISIHGFLSFLINIGIVQLFFVFLTLLSPDFRELVLLTSRLDELWSISNAYGVLRSYGLANGYTSTFPMLMGIYALIVISMVFRTHPFSIKYFCLLFLFFLFVFSVILNARIGLVPIIVYIFFTLFFMLYKLRIFLNGFQIILLASFGFLLLVFSGFELDKYFVRLVWGFEEILSLMAGEKVGTFQVLEIMIHFPNDTTSFFFGTGLAVFGDQNNFPISSDVGFVRDIYMFGFLNTILLLMVVFYLTGSMRKFLKNNFSFVSNVSFLIALSAYYFKGATWSSSEVYNFVVLLSIFSIYSFKASKA